MTQLSPSKAFLLLFGLHVMDLTSLCVLAYKEYTSGLQKASAYIYLIYFFLYPCQVGELGTAGPISQEGSGGHRAQAAAQATQPAGGRAGLQTQGDVTSEPLLVPSWRRRALLEPFQQG